jgi:hypothetical protein
MFAFISFILVCIPFPWHLEGTLLSAPRIIVKYLTHPPQPGTRELAFTWPGQPLVALTASSTRLSGTTMS